MIDLNYVWTYCPNPNDECPILDINDEIGGFGVNGALFCKELSMLDTLGKKEIAIYINSWGGSVFDGWTIFTSIYRAKTPICGYIGGMAASIAGVIFQACDRRIMYSYSRMMVHNPAFNGDNTEVNTDPVLKMIKEQLKDMLRASSKLSQDNIDLLMDGETYMNPEQAVAMGFADEIIKINEEIEEIDIEYIINNGLIVDTHKKYAAVMNNVITAEISKNKNEKMKEKLLKILNLSSSATELDIQNAVKVNMPFLVLNMSEDDETSEEEDDEATDSKNDVDTEDCMNYKEMYENAMEKLSKYENSKILDEVNNAIKLGKIKNSDSSVWIEILKSNFENGAKALNAMSINKNSKPISSIIDKEKTAEVIADVKNEIKKEVEKVSNTDVKLSDVKIDFNSAFKKIK